MTKSKFPLQFNTRAGASILHRTKGRRHRLSALATSNPSQIKTNVTLADEIVSAIAGLAIGVNEGIAQAIALNQTAIGEPVQPIIFVNRYAELEGISIDASVAADHPLGDERRRMTAFGRFFNNHFAEVYSQQGYGWSRHGYPDYFRDIVDASDEGRGYTGSAFTFTNLYSMMPAVTKPGTSAIIDRNVTASNVFRRTENFMLTHLAISGKIDSPVGFGLTKNSTVTRQDTVLDPLFSNRFLALTEASDMLQTVLSARENQNEFSQYPTEKLSDSNRKVTNSLPPIVVDVSSIYSLYRRAGLLEFTTTGAAAGFANKDLQALRTNEYFNKSLTVSLLKGILDTTKEYHPTRFKERLQTQYTGISQYMDILIEADLVTADDITINNVTAEDYKTGYKHGRIISFTQENSSDVFARFPSAELIFTGSNQYAPGEEFKIMRTHYGPSILPSLF